MGTAFLAPLLRLARYSPRAPLWLKAEHLNPTGSVYDHLAPFAPATEFVVAGHGALALSLAVASTRLHAVLPRDTLFEHQQLLQQSKVQLSFADDLHQAHQKAESLGSLWCSPSDPSAVLSAFSGLLEPLDTVGVPVVLPHDGLVSVAMTALKVPCHLTLAPPGSLQTGVWNEPYWPRLAAPQFHPVWDEIAMDARFELARTEGLLLPPASAAAVFVARRIAESEGGALAISLDAGDRYFSQDRRWEAR